MSLSISDLMGRYGKDEGQKEKTMTMHQGLLYDIVLGGRSHCYHNKARLPVTPRSHKSYFSLLRCTEIVIADRSAEEHMYTYTYIINISFVCLICGLNVAIFDNALTVPYEITSLTTLLSHQSLFVSFAACNPAFNSKESQNIVLYIFSPL